MKVLITGARGAIGTHLVPALEEEHDLRLLSRRPATDGTRWAQVDISDLSQMAASAEGMDGVVHLAIARGAEADSADTLNARRFDTNVKGTYNVFEAAARAGVTRVVYASSLTAVWGYPAPERVASDAPGRAVDTYGLTKYLGEEIAAHYERLYPMSVVCLRIPHPIDIEDASSRERTIWPQWVAFPDLVEAFRLALAAPVEGFEIVTIVGESSRRRWDLDKAERVLGYRPQYRLEDHGYTLKDEPETYVR